MDTKKVAALILAVQRGSLTSAAAELGYTQSGLTHMMNSLEDELGLKLLVRRKNGVQLSSAGQSLLEDMIVLSNAAKKLEQSAEKLRESGGSVLRLGAYTSMASRWLPAVLAEFRRIHPEVEVSISVDTIEGNYNMIKNEVLDCAFVSYQKSFMRSLSWVPLRDDELVAIAPKGHPGETYAVEDFSGQEFLMPANGFDMDISPVFSSGIQPRISYTNLDDPAIVSMVEHGLGVSILSRLVMENMSKNVSSVPLSPPAFRKLGIIVSEKRSNDKLINRFISCARQVISDMYE